MFICVHCGREGKTVQSHRGHERLCPKNPNRVYKSHTVGLTAWNKGLNKNTNATVAKNAESIKNLRQEKRPPDAVRGP